MPEPSNALRVVLLEETQALAARVEAQREQAERLRALADRIEERTLADECTLQDLRGELGIAAQLQIDDFDGALGGQRLQRIAINVLEDRAGAGVEIHYREWFDLIKNEGYRVRGKDPVATLLTQLNRSPRVESMGGRSGRYRLKAVA